MNLLLDTCALIWLSSKPSELSLKAADCIDSTDTDLWVSHCSIWEVCVKWQAGKLHLPIPPRLWLEEQREIWKFSWLPMEASHFFRTTELPTFHRDPFDRMLVAQAIERNLVIATPDPEIRKYPVATCW